MSTRSVHARRAYNLERHMLKSAWAKDKSTLASPSLITVKCSLMQLLFNVSTFLVKMGSRDVLNKILKQSLDEKKLVFYVELHMPKKQRNSR